ncbi:MAG TPA: nicotinate (nicotinamide) nucleotide adenylyltransferase [Segetibacter sp.]|jgi:nicotinate-nucleotide adenylyltransferase
MRIGLYFGSFNPIHVGHLIIGSFIANNSDLEEVWYVVSPQNPLKKSAALLNEYHRLHLVKLATEDDQSLKICDIEFKLPRPSFTIDTLTYLKEKNPNHTFSIIMGSDSYQNLNRWKNYEVLLRDYTFYIFLRPQFPIKEEALNIKVLNAPLLEISSTFIRNAIKENKSIRYLVPDKVREEIEKSGYYK